MSDLIILILVTFFGGLLSLSGGMLLLSSKKKTVNIVRYATPFAAGALLGSAFFDILTEAFEEFDPTNVIRYVLFGILVFFLLERFLRVFHHHHNEEDKDHSDPEIPLIVIGDILHSLIDGIAIAAGFVVSPITGIIVALSVAAHELPQEIGDFGLLLSKGMTKKNVIKVNLLTSLATVTSAVIFFTIGKEYELPEGQILGLLAGFFMYIAVSDIIPDIHKNDNNKQGWMQSIMLILGIIFVWATISLLHGFIEV